MVVDEGHFGMIEKDKEKDEGEISSSQRSLYNILYSILYYIIGNPTHSLFAAFEPEQSVLVDAGWLINQVS